LVLVDLNLADGRTGLGLVEALAQLQVPTINVSGETHTVPEATSAKVILSKPFNENGLAKALATIGEEQRPQTPVRANPEQVVKGQSPAARAHEPTLVMGRDRSWFEWFWRQLS
jgi:hypothetical protein